MTPRTDGRGGLRGASQEDHDTPKSRQITSRPSESDFIEAGQGIHEGKPLTLMRSVCHLYSAFCVRAPRQKIHEQIGASKEQEILELAQANTKVLRRTRVAQLPQSGSSYHDSARMPACFRCVWCVLGLWPSSVE